MRRLITSLFLLGLASGAMAATPPGQPSAGKPGGADQPDAEIVKRAVGHASAATYVFHMANEPAQPRPVVVFLHGWGAVNPSVYGGWIDHLARRGYLVLYPAFQTIGRTRPPDASKNAAGLVNAFWSRPKVMPSDWKNGTSVPGLKFSEPLKAMCSR